VSNTDHPYGQLGTYDVDGDKLYGLFIELKGRPVFVDIREDSLLDERKQRAAFLHDNTAALERSLDDFQRQHSDFRTRVVGIIGLHSKDIDRGEVFWDPEGTCLLQGLRFIAT
jgi:hypothetical protein